MAARMKSRETADAHLCIVLGSHNDHDWVTWLYNASSKGYGNGHYFTSEKEARADYDERAKGVTLAGEPKRVERIEQQRKETDELVSEHILESARETHREHGHGDDVDSPGDIIECPRCEHTHERHETEDDPGADVVDDPRCPDCNFSGTLKLVRRVATPASDTAEAWEVGEPFKQKIGEFETTGRAVSCQGQAIAFVYAGMPNGLSNARIIKAAPALLKACGERVKEWHSKPSNFHREEPQSLVLARAALAEAGWEFPGPAAE